MGSDEDAENGEPSLHFGVPLVQLLDEVQPYICAEDDHKGHERVSNRSEGDASDTVRGSRVQASSDKPDRKSNCRGHDERQSEDESTSDQTFISSVAE